jgi:hypothetical protein
MMLVPFWRLLALCRIDRLRRLVGAGRSTVRCSHEMENGVSMQKLEAETDHAVDWLVVCRPPLV